MSSQGTEGALSDTMQGRFFIACADGLKGFLEVIEAVYPQAAVPLCVVTTAVTEGGAVAHHL